ncbi:MAG TPA: hypothetical protein VNE63_21485, partial [Candidatus Acidoferrales bacterium]|nr:hypothetical protein [Candidatus Acidoferrales bacterium]
HGNLLEARMKITAYNKHRSAPFLPSLGQLPQPSLLGRGGSRRRYLIKYANLGAHKHMFLKYSIRAVVMANVTRQYTPST